VKFATVFTVDSFLKPLLTDFTKMCRLQIVIDKEVISTCVNDNVKGLLLTDPLSPFVDKDNFIIS